MTQQTHATDVHTQLTRLAELEEQRAAAAADFDMRIKDIEYQRDQATAELDAAIEQCRASVKTGVLDLGRTVKVDGWMATWNKPRVNWNTKVLDGFAVAHPELLNLRTIGEPTVTIRRTRI